ncbi:hypothetical protein HanXRQr2_Chr02g0052931 [Helianthus annuus]|uniref:Uncharacterized protein n=1 Tax=Helianthus annuus TaxID=4232 RepID=A0A9K3NY01_HELAN|nr:hypothetical protein HanXRQr2_Chr02g0052931 [Helianthus annuus]
MGLKEESSVKLQNLFKKVLTKPASPNTSEVTDIEPDQQKRCHTPNFHVSPVGPVGSIVT